MREWRIFLRRLKDLLQPPRYPEYEEYGRAERTSAGVSTEDASAKLRRVQLVGVFAAIVSIGGGAWMYFGESAPRPATEDPRVREALASQFLTHTGAEGAQPAPRDNLDEIKRWAADIERRVERNVDSVPNVVPGSYRPSAPYYGQGFDASLPLALPAPAVLYDSFPESPAYGEPAAPSSSGGAFAASARTAREPEPAYPAVIPSPAPVMPPAASSPDHASAGDSPAGRYARSGYEPIDYRPRTLERY